MITHLILYIVAFVGIWIGSGLTIRSVEHISRSLRLSSFAVSFLLLGFFTSTSELSVGINSILSNSYEIYVGNLIGASIVLFSLVVPILAVVTGKVVIPKQFQGRSLVTSLVVIAAPVFLVMDGTVTKTDSIISIVLYLFLLFMVESKKGVLENLNQNKSTTKHHVGKNLFFMLLGLVFIFVSSKFIVTQTLYFSSLLGVSSFLVSLLVISLGTNIPELSLAVRSMFSRSNQVAFGDYVGSAAFNTFLIGALTLSHGQTIYLSNSYIVSLAFLVVSLIIFFLYSRTKNSLSRFEGLCLLVFYFLFIATEIIIHQKTI